jgi:hypothetical protein
MATEEREYEGLQAELRQEASVLVIDVKKAELLAQKVLRQHSVRLKVALSELLVKMADEMRSSEVRLRDKAAAVLALKSVGTQLYAWDNEPDIHEVERAKHPLHNMINLDLQATPPERLAETHREKLARESGSRPGSSQDSHETEHKGQRDGTLLTQREGPPAAGDGHQSQKKEDPSNTQASTKVTSSSSEQAEPPRRPGWEQTLQRVQQTNQGNPPLPSATTSSVQFGSPPLYPEERRKQQLEELARMRAEWRGQRR